MLMFSLASFPLFFFLFHHGGDKSLKPRDVRKNGRIDSKYHLPSADLSMFYGGQAPCLRVSYNLDSKEK